jgi:hypothetical protein
MVTKFFESLGGKLAEQWSIATVFPASVFWLAGFAAWGWGHGLRTLKLWNDRLLFLSNLSVFVQAALLAAILLFILASVVIEQRLELRILRLLEGYWPDWPLLRSFRSSCLQRVNRNRDRAAQQFQQLASKRDADPQGVTFDEGVRYVVLDSRLKRIPSPREHRMPTRLGNTLKAAERLPLDKYGLNAATCWPRLWLVLPDGAKTEISGARAGLDAGVRMLFWGVLFAGWAIWAPWAALVAAIAAALAYWWMIDAAEIYADLLESAYDMYRTAVYGALRWPLPANTSQEREHGEALTLYLQRGYTMATVTLTPKAAAEKLHLEALNTALWKHALF